MVEDRCLRVLLHDSSGRPGRCLAVLPGAVEEVSPGSVEEGSPGSVDVGEGIPALLPTHSLVCLAPHTAAIFTQLLRSNSSYR